MSVWTKADKRRDQLDVHGGWREESRQHKASARSLARPMREYAELVPEPNIGPLRFDDFPFQAEWYSPEIADAEEVVWMKAAQVGMCLRPTTRVLTADLRWVPIGDLWPGAELVSVDETHGGKPRGRRLRKATLTARWESVRPVREFVFEDGRRVVSSREHRWLVQRGLRPGGNMAWRAASRIKVGQRIRAIARPWGESDFELGWLAGMLDGEGSMARRALGAEITITQQLGPVYERVCAALRGLGIPFTEQRSPRPNGRTVGRIVVSRGAYVLELLGRCRPTRFDLEEWWQGMAPPGTYGEGAPRIVEINDLPAERVVDIETSTGTFIAEGLVSHNSAYAWRWAVRRVDQFGETGLYIFPTDTHVTEFGDERIEPAIEESPYLRSRISARFVRHKRLKRIGRGFLHLRGSNSKAGAQSVAAQFLVFDEYDYLDQTNLPQIERRISAARQLGMSPRIRRLGYPTIDGEGIAAAFEHSDRRVWMVRCEVCEHEQEITWEDSVRWQNRRRGKVMRAGHDDYSDPTWVAKAWRACTACDSELDVREGRWVATNPQARIPGFHATRLIVHGADLKAIIVASRKTKPAEVEAFENNDLGRPYSSAQAELDQATLLQACERGGELQHAYTGANPVTMGIDAAGERDLTVRVDEQLPAERPDVPNPRRALWIGEVKSFEAVVKLIDAFRPWVVVIDSNPERRMAKSVRANYPPGTVVLCSYDARNTSDPLKVKTGEAGTVLEGVPLDVTVNRTEAIDAMMDSYRQGRNWPLRDPPPRWFEQMRALKRKTELDTKGRPVRLYVTTGSAGDDYAHADVYALVATELLRLRGGVRVLAPPDRPLPDEELGFRRVRLEGDTDDGYTAGFGEKL